MHVITMVWKAYAAALEEHWLLAYSLQVFVADCLLLRAGNIFIIVKCHGFSSEIQCYTDQLKLQDKNRPV